MSDGMHGVGETASAPILQADRECIEMMVAEYRVSLERLYELAHKQGQIDSAKDALRRLERVK